MVKSKFNLDTRFGIYDFFYVERFLFVESQFYIFYFATRRFSLDWARTAYGNDYPYSW